MFQTNHQPNNIIGAVAMLAGDFFQVLHVFVVFSTDLPRILEWKRDLCIKV